MHPMRSNWFIAFEVRAASWFDALTPLPRGARLFHPEDLHATVAFLGPVSEDAAFAAWRLASRLRFQPIAFRPAAILPFGPRQRPSAWSVVPADGAPAIAAMITTHASAMIEAATGSPPRSLHPARPHVTLARPTRAAEPSARAALETWALAQQLPSEAVVIDRLALYTWATDRRARLFEQRAVVAAQPMEHP
jgi:2'-5' RNA ligase